MNKDYVVFEVQTGRIIQSMSISPAALEIAQSDLAQGSDIAEGQGDFMADYVKNGQIVPRPIITISKTEIVADDVDAAVIENLPDICDIFIDGVEYTVQGGRLEITSAMPATYKVFVPERFPRRELTVEIVAK